MTDTTHSSEAGQVTLSSSPPWWSPRRKRFWVVTLLSVYSLVGFFLVPWIAKRELPAFIEAQTGRSASFEEFRFNPYMLSAEATDFRLLESDSQPLISFDRLFVNLQLSSFLRRALVFSELQLDAPFVKVLRKPDGAVNLVQLLKPAPADQAETSLLRLVIDALTVNGGRLDLTDEVPSTDFSTQLGPVDIQLANLSTLPDDSGQQTVDIRTPQGINLGWTGDFSVNPLRSKGRVTGSGPYLPLAYEYLQDLFTFTVESGEAEFGFDYSLAASGDQPADFQISALDVDLTEFVAKVPAESGAFVELPKQSLRGGYLRLGEQLAGADSVQISKGWLRVVRNADGSISLARLLASAADDPAATSATENTADVSEQDSESPKETVAPASASTDEVNQANSPLGDWQLVLGGVQIDQLEVAFTDEALQGDPATINAKEIVIEVGELSTQAGNSSEISASAVIASGGRLQLGGSLQVLPALEVSADLDLRDLNLIPVQPYLAQFANLALESGDLDSQLAITINANEPLGVDGSANLAALDLQDVGQGEQLLGFKELALDRVQFSATKNRLELSEIKLSAPYTRLRIDKDGTTNFQQLLVERPPADEKPQTKPLDVVMGRIAIDGGSADFSDLALPFPFATRIEELKGEITTLATNSREPAKLDLEGKVGEYGLAEASGRISPAKFSNSTDLSLLFRNVELPDLSPYTVKFAGRRIDDGRLNLDLRYVLDQGKMKGDNRVSIDKLTLGEKEDYPGAKNLPLALAVALLKEPDGTINIDLPVSGDVNDPKFSIGGVIFRAFANLITKLATSPFRLLGGLVGAESEAMDLIEFRPGEAELTPPEREKLAKLAEALAMRPQFVVQVPGVIDKEADTQALRVARVDAAVAAILAAQSGRKAEALLTERQRRALENLVKESLSADVMKAAKAAAQKPEQADDPNSKLSLDEPAYIAALRQALIDAEEITDEELDNLSVARATAVVDALTADGKLPAERVNAVAAVEAKPSDAGWIPLKLKAGAAGQG